MAEVKPSYLTCTAAEADEFNATNPHDFLSLNQLLECRAATDPDVRIAGFPERDRDNSRWTLLEFSTSTKDNWEKRGFAYYQLTAFASLLRTSNCLATNYLAKTTLKLRSPDDKQDRIVALLSPSCAELLVNLFAALRLGYGVLLLA